MAVKTLCGPLLTCLFWFLLSWIFFSSHYRDLSGFLAFFPLSRVRRATVGFFFFPGLLSSY
jgi:hypothetical protein